MSRDESVAILESLASAERGPRRDGTFAIWLVVRAARDLVLASEWPERAHRRRLQALERRLTSLSLSPSLRRALGGALAQVRDLGPESAVQALAQLVTPARESLGTEVAEAIRRVVTGLRAR
jgi:hypothetical protein